MSTMLIQSDTLSDIADAIREKLGVSDTYLPSEMPEAISSITGGGGGGGGDWDMSTPLYSLFKVNSTQTSIYTAEAVQRVLVLNSEVIDEANFAHDSRAIVTTTGNIIRSVIQSTTHNDNTKTRDSETQLALIDLQIGDTVTIENSAVTSHVNKTHLIWDGTDIEDIANEFYDAIVDSARDNTKTVSTDLSTSHILWCQQVSGSNDNLNAAITVSSGTMSSVYIANETRNKIDAKVVKGPAVATYSTAAANDYTSKIYGVWSLVIGDKGEKVPLITRTKWNLLSASAKRRMSLTAIEDYVTGFNRGELVNGANYIEPGIYIPNSDASKVICEAYVSNFDITNETWGAGVEPVKFTGNDHAFDSTENAISILTNRQGDIASIDLGAPGTPFTAYMVMKLVNPQFASRIMCSVASRSSGQGMTLYGQTVHVSSWANDTDTGISTTSDYFVACLQFGGSGAGLGIARGGDFITKPPATAGRYVTLGRTDLNPDTYNAEPCDILVRYVAVVKDVDSQQTISDNLDVLYNAFVANPPTPPSPRVPVPSIYFDDVGPVASLGEDGDYYYTRLKEPSVCVPYWDNRQSSNTSISGYEFVTAAECDAVGLRVFNRSSSRTVTAGLYDENGTVIEEVTGEAESNTWTTLLFTTRRRLQSGTKYLSIANWGETGHAVYRSTYTIATDSRIVNTSLKGRYNSVPGTVDNDNIYGCDVLLDTAGESYYLIKEQYVKEDGAWVKIS